VVPTSVGLHIDPLSLVVPVSRVVYGIQFREGECVPFETIRRFALQLCRVNDVTGRGISYLRGNSTEFKKAVRYDFESLAIFGIVNKEPLSPQPLSTISILGAKRWFPSQLLWRQTTGIQDA
jgi:hypothetical protein